jgi:hypothetical protein
MKKVGPGQTWRVFSLFLIFSLSFVLCSKKVVKKFVRWVKKLFLVFFSGWFFRRKPEKERERREREKGRGKSLSGCKETRVSILLVEKSDLRPNSNQSTDG